jgi:hypothetical protein
MYSYTVFLTSALDRVGGQRQAPAALPPGKTRYPLYRGGPQGQSGWVRKILPPTGFDPQTVQSVANRNTDLGKARKSQIMLSVFRASVGVRTGLGCR